MCGDNPNRDAASSYTSFGHIPVIATRTTTDTATVRQADVGRARFEDNHFCERILIMMKKLMLVLVALTIGSPVFLTGCNTVQGAGKDVEKAGNKIQEEAVEHKKY